MLNRRDFVESAIAAASAVPLAAGCPRLPVAVATTDVPVGDGQFRTAILYPTGTHPIGTLPTVNVWICIPTASAVLAEYTKGERPSEDNWGISVFHNKRVVHVADIGAALDYYRQIDGTPWSDPETGNPGMWVPCLLRLPVPGEIDPDAHIHCETHAVYRESCEDCRKKVHTELSVLSDSLPELEIGERFPLDPKRVNTLIEAIAESCVKLVNGVYKWVKTYKPKPPPV